jgi:hypothetical protein
LTMPAHFSLSPLAAIAVVLAAETPTATREATATRRRRSDAFMVSLQLAGVELIGRLANQAAGLLTW